MNAIDNLIKDANSILNTLDKDYEAMQSQKSDVRQEQINIFNDLCENMKDILNKYFKTIIAFREKLTLDHDSEGDELTVYEFTGDNKVLTIVPVLFWTGDCKLTFKLKINEKATKGRGYYNTEYITISITGIEQFTVGFNDKAYSNTVSIFLNHCPSYEQLDTAFQTALANFIKYCVTSVQQRNETLADKIKTITS